MNKISYTEELWNGYRRLNFQFEGRDAIIVLPHTPSPHGEWLLKTEYFNAFPEFELEMLSRGFHLAYLKNITRWHDARDDEAKAHFCAFLADEFSLAHKCLPVGMSCGGMLAIYFAAKYPDLVGALYLDAPVLNLLSCPCGVGRGIDRLYDEFTRHTGMTRATLINYRNHPIDKLGQLLDHHIPIMMVAGDADEVVPYEENGAHLVEQYRARGGDVTEIIKPGIGHHPHGLTDCAPLVAFALQKYKVN